MTPPDSSPHAANDTQPDSPTDLAALVASRLCHDLISPIGAVGNGLELLALDPRQKTAELGLIADSVASANVKLRFFRIAFGHAACDQKVSRTDILPLLAELYRNSRIALDWNSPTDLARPEAKLAYLMLLCAEHALPTGGTLAVQRDAAGGWTLRASSPRLRHDHALWSRLASRSPETTADPAQVQFPLAAAQLLAIDRRALVDVGVSTLTVSF